MIVNGIGQFPVVEEYEPSSLPALGAVNRVSKVPVGRDEEVATPGDVPRRLGHLERGLAVVHLELVAVRALELVELVRLELAALPQPHGDGFAGLDHSMHRAHKKNCSSSR